VNQLLKTIVFKAGAQGPSAPLEIQPGHVTLFVGPNHSGKSLLLREIHGEIPRTEPIAGNKVLARLSFYPLDAVIQEKLRQELTSSASDYLVGEQSIGRTANPR